MPSDRLAGCLRASSPDSVDGAGMDGAGMDGAGMDGVDAPSSVPVPTLPPVDADDSVDVRDLFIAAASRLQRTSELLRSVAVAHG